MSEISIGRCFGFGTRFEELEHRIIHQTIRISEKHVTEGSAFLKYCFDMAQATPRIISLLW